MATPTFACALPGFYGMTEVEGDDNDDRGNERVERCDFVGHEVGQQTFVQAPQHAWRYDVDHGRVCGRCGVTGGRRER